MIIGTVLIAGGAVLIAIFGIVPEPTHSLEDLLRLFGQTSFIVYFSLLGVLVVACMTVVSLLLMFTGIPAAYYWLDSSYRILPGTGSSYSFFRTNNISRTRKHHN